MKPMITNPLFMSPSFLLLFCSIVKPIHIYAPMQFPFILQWKCKNQSIALPPSFLLLGNGHVKPTLIYAPLFPIIIYKYLYLKQVRGSRSRRGKCEEKLKKLREIGRKCK